ncbi:transglutaminase TgpA family protein [Aquibacillus sediminis]|uniref:transglutaminase TgpA family protein n=1 Tax=Aquibacillus sediminis TaxID=2574734 RepID=UPI0011099C04|nr:transglutaminaseTgpA domain-containing protein [Aquibacillus sediminis]
MDRSSSNYQTVIYQTIIYFCGFILFWEWLRPLEEVSDTGSLSVFITFAAFCFFLSLLRLRWWWSIPLKLAGVILIIDGLFISERLFSSSWFYVIAIHVRANIEFMWNEQWTEMTSLFRSLLFLVLIWLMIYLLYYWFVVVKRVFFFVLLTMIYLTLLDTFTMYQANAAIVRTFIVSVIALGMSSLLKEMDRDANTTFQRNHFVTWILPFTAVVLFAVMIGVFAPKLEPQWPDPVPFITSTAENAGMGDGTGRNGSLQKVGYGEDDSNLGGSFVQDDTVVFEVAAQEEHYWRIESKDRYTGKGWERTSDLNYQSQDGSTIHMQMVDDSVQTTEQMALVNFTDTNDFDKFVYPYGIGEIVSDESGVQYLLDQETGTIKADNDSPSTAYDRYQVNYQYPSYSLDQLRANSEQGADQIEERYLQLPEDLPERVYDLAAQETEDEDSRYDKVKAIESYFRYNGFRYQTENVARPSEEQDYVDQFLFETKVGYCDNFSTSMVVMLRTLGIPARWAKGFTSGEQLMQQPEGVPEGLDVYQVTNANAHSWVEVYFPEVGWVPFEPTQGFSSPVDFYQETSAPEQSEEEIDREGGEEEEQEDQTEQSLTEEEDRDDAAVSGQNQRTLIPWFWVIMTISLAIISIVLYMTRLRWRAWMLMRSYRNNLTEQNFQAIYHHLLKVLDHKGIKRGQGQTLRSYAKDVDSQLATTDMSQLTSYYERLLYGNGNEKMDSHKTQELLENLVKRVLS